MNAPPSLPPEFAALLPGGQITPTGNSHTVLFKPASPTAGMSTGEKLLAGTGQGMMTILRHAGNLAGGIGGTTDADLQQDAKYDSPLLTTTAGKIGNFNGESAALAPIGGGADAALGKLGLMSPLARGAIQGAAQGFLSADPGHRTAGTLLGGATGAVLPAVGKGISTLVRGIARTPAAQALINAGIRLTPGQLNPRGIFNRMEQALESIPVVGDLAQNARESAGRRYSRAMVERSMAPGAKLSPQVSDFNDMVSEAKKSFDTAYDTGKGFPVGPKIMTNTATNTPLSDAINTVGQRARPGITTQDQTTTVGHVQDLLKQTIADAKQSGGMQSDHLIDFRSQLRELARGEDTTTNAGRAKAGLYKDAVDKVTDALRSQLPGHAMSAMDAADAQYGKFAVIRDAAKAAKDAPNGPTPFQLSNAIAQNTPKNAYAAGAGANRDLAKAAREVFQSNVPRTGFTGVGRVLLPLAAAGGAGATGAALMNGKGGEGGDLAKGGLGTLGTLAALGAMAYSPTGRDAFAGNTGVQRALAGALARSGQALSPTLQRLLRLYASSGLQAHTARRLQAPQ